MSQSTVFHENQPNSGMKKKVIIAIAAVVVGHIGVIGLLSQMKVLEIKPIHKEPLKVRFVKIQPPPAPPKPKEQPKPQPKKEVKEVKIVKQQLPPPPKKVEKVQQVKAETPKQVVQPPVVTPTPVVSTTVSETKTVVKAADPTPVKTVAPAAPPADKSPKSVTIGGSGVQWSRSPRVSVTPSDLKGSARSVVVAIEADEKGAVISVRIVKSSGLPDLDEKIVKAVRNAKFKPYKENGVAYPIRANQPFDLN